MSTPAIYSIELDHMIGLIDVFVVATSEIDAVSKYPDKEWVARLMDLFQSGKDSISVERVGSWMGLEAKIYIKKDGR